MSMKAFRSLPNVVRSSIQISCVGKHPHLQITRGPHFTGCPKTSLFQYASSGRRNLATTSLYFQSTDPKIKTSENFVIEDENETTYVKVDHFPSFEDEKEAKLALRKLTEDEFQLLTESLHEYNETRNDDVTWRQLSAVALGNFIPFVGFGFIDNVIMIFAGDYIDVKIGSYMGISIMAAAAMGNMVADIAGLSLAGYIETFSSKLGMVQTNLTTKQYAYTSVKLFKYGGCIIGVMIGCIIGMFPLLLIGER